MFLLVTGASRRWDVTASLAFGSLLLATSCSGTHPATTGDQPGSFAKIERTKPPTWWKRVAYTASCTSEGVRGSQGYYTACLFGELLAEPVIAVLALEHGSSVWIARTERALAAHGAVR